MSYADYEHDFWWWLPLIDYGDYGFQWWRRLIVYDDDDDYLWWWLTGAYDNDDDDGLRPMTTVMMIPYHFLSMISYNKADLVWWWWLISYDDDDSLWLPMMTIWLWGCPMTIMISYDCRWWWWWWVPIMISYDEFDIIWFHMMMKNVLWCW